jgi:hypothetical protein
MRTIVKWPGHVQGVALCAALGVTLLLSPLAEAHQRQLIQIEGADYLVVVGFVNEPVFVGDKTGVDLIVRTPDPTDPTDSFAPKARPVEGLEKSLKVEVKAGPHARVFELYPAFRAPGRYQAVFYPTVQTTYSFRFFGTVNRVPLDLVFTCNPAGHVAYEDRTVVKLSAQVTRKAVIGSFGCPERRDEVEFPPARRQP